MIPIANEQETQPLWELLQKAAVFLWKDWPKDMEVKLLDMNSRKFTMRGTCPHPDCNRPSVFILVTSVYVDVNDWIAALQCQGCFKFLLAQACTYSDGRQLQLRYVSHYPLGSPNDVVASEIPEHIQEDFKEALRCIFVNAYNATAEMCRRAIEASCIDLGAPKKLKVLEDKIDWLADSQKITPDLKDAAHKVRLGGNRGAHPPEDGPKEEDKDAVEDGPIEKIEKEHAEAIVAFTHHFFQYVYVIPKQLDKYDFSKPKAKTP